MADEEVPTLYVNEAVDSKLLSLYVQLNKCPVTIVKFNVSNKKHVELNPLKVVPILVVKDVIVWGTVAVFMYLAEKYTSNALYGQSVEERAKINSIIFWVGGTLNRSVLMNYVYPKTNQTYSLPESNNNKLIELGQRNTIQQLDTLEEHYFNKSNFMFGGRETIVDYYTAIILMELCNIQFDFTKWPKLISWLDGMKPKVETICL